VNRDGGAAEASDRHSRELGRLLSGPDGVWDAVDLDVAAAACGRTPLRGRLRASAAVAFTPRQVRDLYRAGLGTGDCGWVVREGLRTARALEDRVGSSWRPEAEVAADLLLAHRIPRLAELALQAESGVVRFTPGEPGAERLARLFPFSELVSVVG
jgi:hypothetical protein